MNHGQNGNDSHLRTEYESLIDKTVQQTTVKKNKVGIFGSKKVQKEPVR